MNGWRIVTLLASALSLAIFSYRLGGWMGVNLLGTAFVFLNTYVQLFTGIRR